MKNVILVLVFLNGLPAMVLADKAKGKELYLSYGCALCHGLEGRGDGLNARKFDPAPTDFHDPQSYRHGRDKDSIRSAIRYGIKEEGSIMPSFKDIPSKELDQIVDYVKSLQDKLGGHR